MKRFTIFWVILMGGVFCFHAQSFAQKPISASTKSKAKTNITIWVAGSDDGVCKVVSNEFTTFILEKGSYMIAERSPAFLTQIAKEQKHQLSGQVDDAQIARLGRQFGVKMLCAIEIEKVMDQFTLTARLLDIESAQVLASADGYRDFKSIQDIKILAKAVVKQLFENK